MTINCQPVRWFARLHSIKWATIPDEMTTNENCGVSRVDDDPRRQKANRQTQLSQTSQTIPNHKVQYQIPDFPESVGCWLCGETGASELSRKKMEKKSKLHRRRATTFFSELRNTNRGRRWFIRHQRRFALRS